MTVITKLFGIQKSHLFRETSLGTAWMNWGQFICVLHWGDISELVQMLQERGSVKSHEEQRH